MIEVPKRNLPLMKSTTKISPKQTSPTQIIPPHVPMVPSPSLLVLEALIAINKRKSLNSSNYNLKKMTPIAFQTTQFVQQSMYIYCCTFLSSFIDILVPTWNLIPKRCKQIKKSRMICSDNTRYDAPCYEDLSDEIFMKRYLCNVIIV